MKCPNCNNTKFQIMTHSEPFHQCERCGWFVCAHCAGTGAQDAPFSGSDPMCSECGGEGAFDPDWILENAD